MVAVVLMLKPHGIVPRPVGLCSVRLSSGEVVEAHMSARALLSRTRIAVGDEVEIEMSGPRARIIGRRAGSTQAPE